MTNRGEKNLHGDISAAGAYAEAIREKVDSYDLLNRNGSVWHTVHTSVYDCETRTLYIIPQESGYPYMFELKVAD